MGTKGSFKYGCNFIQDVIWPTRLCYIIPLCSVLLVMLWFEPIPTESLNERLWRCQQWLPLEYFNVPTCLKAPILSGVIGILLFVKICTLRRYLLRIILSYRGWMYDRKPSKITLLWGLLLRLFTSSKPKTYNCQLSLPRQPVPPLKETVRKLVESLEPLSSEKEMKELHKAAKEFVNGIGWKLQIILQLKSWIASNYITDWWEKYVYMMSRLPLPINSNYCCIDQNHWTPTPIQAARAGALLHRYLRFKSEIENEEFPTMLIQDTVPLCMEQFRKIFSTVRIPGETTDRLVHYHPNQTKHLVAICKGIMYKVEVYDSNNQYLPSETLEKLFQWVIEDAESNQYQITNEEKKISSLTALDRTKWAKIRKQYFHKYSTNKDAIALVESAICCVVFPDFAPKTLTEKGRFLFHGDGQSLWFDKCVSYVFFSDGQAGWHAEHSLADAPTMGYFWEYYLSREASEKLYTEDGHCIPPMLSHRVSHFQLPQKISWNVNSTLAKEIRNAYKVSQSDFEDLDYVAGEHTWGKRLMKKWKVSPDGFIQISIQLAYFKLSGKLALTYEASMTRLYLCGRTETVRSCTKEVAKFIKAMYDDTVPIKEKVILFRKACERHQNLYRDAMNGKGIDRHLFCLYVLSKMFGYENDFLKLAMSKPWTLSTSQQPQRQQQDKSDIQDVNCPYLSNKLSPGGGFGPTVQDGYGVSYMLSTEDLIYFHVASRKSGETTNSQKFIDQLFQCMDDLRTMFSSQELK